MKKKVNSAPEFTLQLEIIDFQAQTFCRSQTLSQKYGVSVDFIRRLLRNRYTVIKNFFRDDNNSRYRYLHAEKRTLEYRVTVWHKKSKIKTISLTMLRKKFLHVMRTWKLQVNITPTYVRNYAKKHGIILTETSKNSKKETLDNSDNLTQPTVIHSMKQKSVRQVNQKENDKLEISSMKKIAKKSLYNQDEMNNKVSKPQNLKSTKQISNSVLTGDSDTSKSKNVINNLRGSNRCSRNSSEIIVDNNQLSLKNMLQKTHKNKIQQGRIKKNRKDTKIKQILKSLRGRSVINSKDVETSNDATCLHQVNSIESTISGLNGSMKGTETLRCLDREQPALKMSKTNKNFLQPRTQDNNNDTKGVPLFKTKIYGVRREKTSSRKRFLRNRNIRTEKEESVIDEHSSGKDLQKRFRDMGKVVEKTALTSSVIKDSQTNCGNEMVEIEKVQSIKNRLQNLTATEIDQTGESAITNNQNEKDLDVPEDQENCNSSIVKVKANSGKRILRNMNKVVEKETVQSGNSIITGRSKEQNLNVSSNQGKCNSNMVKMEKANSLKKRPGITAKMMENETEQSAIIKRFIEKKRLHFKNNIVKVMEKASGVKRRLRRVDKMVQEMEGNEDVADSGSQSFCGDSEINGIERENKPADCEALHLNIKKKTTKKGSQNGRGILRLLRSNATDNSNQQISSEEGCFNCVSDMETNSGKSLNARKPRMNKNKKMVNNERRVLRSLRSALGNSIDKVSVKPSEDPRLSQSLGVNPVSITKKYSQKSTSAVCNNKSRRRLTSNKAGFLNKISKNKRSTSLSSLARGKTGENCKDESPISTHNLPETIKQQNDLFACGDPDFCSSTPNIPGHDSDPTHSALNLTDAKVSTTLRHKQRKRKRSLDDVLTFDSVAIDENSIEIVLRDEKKVNPAMIEQDSQTDDYDDENYGNADVKIEPDVDEADHETHDWFFDQKRLLEVSWTSLFPDLDFRMSSDEFLKQINDVHFDHNPNVFDNLKILVHDSYGEEIDENKAPSTQGQPMPPNQMQQPPNQMPGGYRPPLPPAKPPAPRGPPGGPPRMPAGPRGGPMNPRGPMSRPRPPMVRPRGPGVQPMRGQVRPRVNGPQNGIRPNGQASNVKRNPEQANAMAKRKKLDVLTPSDKDDDDCQVICMQPKNTDGGLPQIESVQGGSESAENSIMHLSDSITLSVRNPPPKPVASPQKSDAKAVANILATRGITVTASAKPKEKENTKSPPAVPTALSLNGAVSIVAKSNGAANNKSASENLPTVDLTDDSTPPQTTPTKKGPGLPYRCDLCPAQYPNALGLNKHRQTYHKTAGGMSELGVPVINLKQAGIMQKLTQMGINNYIPLPSPGADGTYAIPIISTKQPGNVAALGATQMLSLGPVRTIPRPNPPSPIKK